MDSVTPKWAREAEEHLVKLSSRLDAAEAYIKSLEALRDEMLAALEDGLQWLETGRVDGVAYDEQSVAESFRAAIERAKGN